VVGPHARLDARADTSAHERAPDTIERYREQSAIVLAAAPDLR